MKNFKNLDGFEGCCLKIKDVCMDFEPYFKVHNLVSVHPKSITLGQRTNLDMIFHVVVSVYRLVKIWNSPQFPAEFWNSLLGQSRAGKSEPVSFHHPAAMFVSKHQQDFKSIIFHPCVNNIE